MTIFKKQLFFYLIFLCLCNCKSTNSNNLKTVNPEKYAKTITSTELKDLLFVYASNEFEGRDTGSPGQKKAVNFIQKQYEKIKIPGGLSQNNYFQEVPLSNQKVSTSTIKYNNNSYDNFKTQVVLNASESTELKVSEFVYANYGIEDENYSDYKDVNIKNKIVLIKAGEPKVNENYITTGTPEETKWTNLNNGIQNKIEIAKNKGAKLLIIHPQLFDKYSKYYKTIFDEDKAGRMSLLKEVNKIPVLMINEKLGNDLMNSIKDKALSQIISKQLEISITYNSEVKSENVLAFIKGNEKPDEIIVISAHLDHIGMRDGKIFNGADDDGSGTVAVLEIAEAFSKAKKEGYGPKRSILFLHVTGEEKGLFGSRYYTDYDPVFPLKNTIANLNIDMIGRVDPERKEGTRNYVYLIGSDKLSTDLHNISEEINLKCCNLELDYTFNDENDPNRFYYRSDHYNFAKNNIPVIFYFNGTHEDYHQHTDTPDKIEYDLLENRAKLIFYTAWELANREEKIKVDKAN